MTLLEYAKRNNLRYRELGELIGLKTSSAFRLAKLNRYPSQPVMTNIIRATHGLVTPNDFFREELEAQPLYRRKKSKA